MSKHFAIFAAPNHADSFELVGVLTDEADAKQFATRLEQSGKYQAVTPPEYLEMYVILDLLVKDRLRELAEPIQRLAASVLPNNPSSLARTMSGGNPMDDRDLLELAAIAAGHEIAKNAQCGRDAAGFGDVGLWLTNGTTCWNPLTDNGQALRLAVDLCLRIEPGTRTRGYAVARTGHANWREYREPHGDSPAAATRRVIVRAAAEIGKQSNA